MITDSNQTENILKCLCIKFHLVSVCDKVAMHLQELERDGKRRIQMSSITGLSSATWCSSPEKVWNIIPTHPHAAAIVMFLHL